MILESFCLVVVLLVFFYIRGNWGNSKAPPGPPRLPFLGNLFQIVFSDPVPHLGFHKLSQKYGPVMSLKFGFQDAILLSSSKVVKDIFAMDESAKRPMTGMFSDRNLHQNIGIIFGTGEQWKNNRRFTTRALRDYGFGKRSSMQGVMDDELNHFVSHLKKIIIKQKGIIHFHLLFTGTILNVLWSLVAGKRYEYTDDRIIKLFEVTQKFMKSGTIGSGVITAYPFLRFVFPNWLGYNAQTECNATLREFFRDIMREYRDKLSKQSEPENIIEAYLSEMKKGSESIYTEDNFVVTLIDLFQAGSETTSNTLSFAILFMTTRPDIQQKVVKEIENVIGFERSPQIEDRNEMIYTQATLLEVFRWARTAVNFVPHMADKDFYYDNMLIKKDTMILGNQHSVNFDEKFWGDPEVFRPERFLDLNGQLIKENAEHIIPFSTGKRVCLGETLARDSLFFYFTTLLQQFSFQTVPGQPPPSPEPVIGLTMSTVPFDAVVTPRMQ